MSGKRLRFIVLWYLVVAFLLNTVVDGPDSSLMIALIAVVVISYFVYPSDDTDGKDKEQEYPGRDPREG